MTVKKALGYFKPGIKKLGIFLLLALFLGVYVKDSFCAVGIGFAFCIQKFGFPFTSYASKGPGGIPDSFIDGGVLTNKVIAFSNINVYPYALLVNLLIYYLFICIAFFLMDIAKVDDANNLKV